MALAKVNFTGAVAAATQLIAAPTTPEQLMIEKIIVSVGKVQSGKILKFYEAGGGAAPFFVVDLGVGEVHPFEPVRHYPLPAATALHYEADSTAVNCSIVVEYGTT